MDHFSVSPQLYIVYASEGRQSKDVIRIDPKSDLAGCVTLNLKFMI